MPRDKHSNNGVFPYFAEGWNLPLLECLSLGIPCIATYYSGPVHYLLDLCNTCASVATKFMIYQDELNMCFANDGIFFRSSPGLWAEVKPEAVANRIRLALSSQNDMRSYRHSLAKFGQKYSWTNPAIQALEALETHSK